MELGISQQADPPPGVTRNLPQKIGINIARDYIKIAIGRGKNDR